jgi:hypothetical protein
LYSSSVTSPAKLLAHLLVPDKHILQALLPLVRIKDARPAEGILDDAACIAVRLEYSSLVAWAAGPPPRGI